MIFKKSKQVMVIVNKGFSVESQYMLYTPVEN